MSDCTHDKLVEGYYGHDCAACGVLVYPYGSEPWNEYEPDDEETRDAWLDSWLEKCGALKNTALPCPLAGTEECDFECPFRTKYDGPKKTTRR